MIRNLQFCVQQFKLNYGIVTTEHDQRFLQWHIQGLKKERELELYDQCVKSTKLWIDQDTNTANLPADYEDFLQIGICCNGVFINFDVNPTLCENTNICPCNSDQISAGISGCCNNTAQFGGSGDYNWPIFAYPFWGEAYSWSYSTGSYAQGPGFYTGGYKINLAQRTIQFDRCVRAESVIMVYFGDVTDDCGNALVTDNMVEILNNYADWMMERFKPNKNQGAIQQARNTWYTSHRDLVAKENKLNRSQWFKLIRRFMYLGIKA